MRFLVTAGNTQTLIDRVRCLTNIFSGRTGGRIALAAHARGHTVSLLTSHPESVPVPAPSATWKLTAYKTFEDLEDLLKPEIQQGSYDVIVHAAAVSDFARAGIFVPAPGTHFDPESATWSASAGSPHLVDVIAGKVKSKHGELWLRLTPTPKLVDQMRTPWGFRGVLVKFKLEVDTGDEQLLEVAERSRLESRADWMVANTLEGMQEWAFVGPVNGAYEKVLRADLADRLLDLLGA
ncbi:MAG TPA: phosphopantothenoylcysteine decarboxylase [Gemmataceae bacterium]|jgi:phosphopantothenoylcysteine synthetase/decarboxylase|nr:phosphopantothenoylcysteine decarboxylase [Gemmataceae bacterium]